MKPFCLLAAGGALHDCRDLAASVAASACPFLQPIRRSGTHPIVNKAVSAQTSPANETRKPTFIVDQPSTSFSSSFLHRQLLRSRRNNNPVDEGLYDSAMAPTSR